MIVGVKPAGTVLAAGAMVGALALSPAWTAGDASSLSHRTAPAPVADADRQRPLLNLEALGALCVLEPQRCDRDRTLPVLPDAPEEVERHGEPPEQPHWFGHPCFIGEDRFQADRCSDDPCVQFVEPPSEGPAGDLLRRGPRRCDPYPDARPRIVPLR